MDKQRDRLNLFRLPQLRLAIQFDSSPPIWLIRFGNLAIWALLVALAFGLITISPSFLATLIAFFLLLLWPGLLLQQLLKVDPPSLPNKLVLAFTLSFGLWSVPLGLLLWLHANITLTIWAVVTITLILSLAMFFHSPRREPAPTMRNPGISSLPWTSVVYGIAFVAALVLILMTQANIAGPFYPSDRINYQNYISHFLNTDKFLIGGLLKDAPQNGRVQFFIWVLLQALVVQISQVNLLEMYVYYLPPLLIALSFVTLYYFAKELFNNQLMALLACLVQTLYYFSDITQVEGIGYGFFLRLIEDKFLLSFILLPVALLLTLRYLKQGGREVLAGLVTAIIALGFGHPLGLVWYGISFGLFTVTTLVFTFERKKLVRSLWVAIILMAVLIIPLLQRQQLASSPSILPLEDATFGLPINNTELAKRLFILNREADLYIASPSLIAHPLVILAALLTPLLFKRLRTSLGAQFIFANMLGVLLLCYTPGITSLLGKAITSWMVYRILWLLPVSLVISFFLSEIAQKLSSTFKHPGLMLAPLGILVLSVWLFRGRIVNSLSVLEQTKSSFLTAEQVEVLTYLREHSTPLSTVMTPDDRFSDEVRGLDGHSYGLTLYRATHRLGLTRLDLSMFYATSFMSDSHLHTLRQGHVTYVVLNTDSVLVTQFEELAGIFKRLYTNQSYIVYQWHPERISETEAAIIQGNTYLLEGKLLEAETVYRQILQQIPEHPLALIGLGAIAEAHKDFKQAFSCYQQAANLLPNTVWLQTKLADLLWIDPADMPAYLAMGERYQEGQVANWKNSKWAIYSFLDHLDLASLSARDSNLIRRSAFIINKQPRGVIFQHPSSRLAYSIDVPSSARLDFGIALAPEVWKLGQGDGVQFDIYIDSGQADQKIFSKYIDPKNIPADRRWYDYEIDLASWASQTITITFATTPGPNGNEHYDWAGWGEPRIVQPIAYNFLTELPTTDHEGADGKQLRQDTLTIDYNTRPILFQHPSNQIAYRLNMPEQARLYFGLGIDPAVWSPDKGDGIAYSIYVRQQDKPHLLYQVFYRYIDPKHNSDDRRWLDQVVDLSAYGGQTVDIIFEASPGPVGNTNFDWGGWSMPILVTDGIVSQNTDLPPVNDSDR